MPTSPKSFVWYELMTSDMNAAEAFYKKVIGWNSEPFSGPMPYTIMKAGDDMIAGVMTLPEEARAMGGQPGWVGYIYADDVDAQTESVKQAGGKVYKAPEDIPNVGRFSVVTDPQGAIFMLFKPNASDTNPTPPPMGTPGHVGWRELYTTDWSEAFDFYSKQFGWTKDQAMDMGPMGTYQLFAAGGEAIGGMMNKPENVPMPAWGFYFGVPAIDAAITCVQENGGQVLNGPMEVPGGAWVVNCMDPQHAMFSLVAPTR